jgi:hypothetical protein
MRLRRYLDIQARRRERQWSPVGYLIKKKYQDTKKMQKCYLINIPSSPGWN